ncbi:unnamed protein product [Rotaria magnacalcarata]
MHSSPLSSRTNYPKSYSRRQRRQIRRRHRRQRHPMKTLKPTTKANQSTARIRKNFNMHLSTVLFAVFVAFYCANVVSASGSGMGCQCSCCLSTKRGACTPVNAGSVIIDTTKCDNVKCIDACKAHYPLCETKRGLMQSTCKDFEAEATSISDSTLAPTTVTTTTSTIPITSATTGTLSTTTAVSSSISTAASSNTAGSSSTPTTGGSSTTTAGGSSTTTAGGSSTTSAEGTSPTTAGGSSTTTDGTASTPKKETTTRKSGASTIQSVFQLSHLLLLSFALTFLCL